MFCGCQILHVKNLVWHKNLLKYSFIFSNVTPLNVKKTNFIQTRNRETTLDMCPFSLYSKHCWYILMNYYYYFPCKIYNRYFNFDTEGNGYHVLYVKCTNLYIICFVSCFHYVETKLLIRRKMKGLAK